ncbi:MAG: DUF4097 domain-containing protein [Treponema sp.]|jgi:DUF4097 and DUF4098 domain-containing protein YvlB|nr:DUF4097 domain-containing protein [Treponema sp.]
MEEKRIGIIIAACLLLGAGVLSAAPMREETRTFSLDEVESLVIAYRAGRVSFRESGGGELILTERLRDAEDAKVSAEGRMLRITGDERPWFPFSVRRIEAEIAIPRSYRGDLRAQTGSGSVYSDAHLISDGVIEIRVSSGAMNLRRLSAREITLRSASGSIQADEISGSSEIVLSSGSLDIGKLSGERHRIRSSSGSVRIDEAEGSTDAELSSGGLRFGSLKGERHRIRASSGTIHAGELGGAAEFTASSGGVRVDAARLSGDLSFDLRSGGLDLRLAGDTAFNLDAETSSGRIRVVSPEGEYSTSDRSSVVRPFGANPQYTIYARVRSGYITIIR